MPTYLNRGEYMQMSNLIPNNAPFGPPASRVGNESQRGNESQGFSSFGNDQMSCLQILNHIQNCPICHHVFSPHKDVTKKMYGSVGNNIFPTNTDMLKIEVSPIALFTIVSLIIILILLLISRK